MLNILSPIQQILTHQNHKSSITFTPKLCKEKKILFSAFKPNPH